MDDTNVFSEKKIVKIDLAIIYFLERRAKKYFHEATAHSLSFRSKQTKSISLTRAHTQSLTQSITYKAIKQIRFLR